MKKSDLEIGIYGMFWMGLMTIMSYLIQLVIMYFLARLLSPHEFGEFASITILTGLAEIFWMMGVGPSIVQKINLSEDDIVTGNSLNILFGIIVFSIINLNISMWSQIFNISNINMLRVFSLIFPLRSLSGVSQSLLQKKCKFKLISLINFVSLCCYGVFVLIFAFNQFGPWALVYSKLIQALCLTILLMHFEPMKLKIKVNKNSAKELLYFGGGFTIAKFFNYVANNGDYFVVNKTMGKSDLGSYSKAYQLLMYPVNFIGATLDQVLFPILSKSQDDNRKLKKVFVSGSGLIALLSVPISIVAFISAENLVFFFLGNQWGNTVVPFKIMIIGLYFRIAYKLSDSLIRALGKVYHRAVIQFMYAFMMILGAYIGHFYGLAGVALGVAFSFITNYFLMTILSMKFVNIKVSEIITSVFPAVIYGLITTVVMFHIRFLWINISNSLIKLIIVTLIVFSIYGLLFKFTRKKILSKEVDEMVNAILKHCNSKLKALLKR